MTARRNILVGMGVGAALMLAGGNAHAANSIVSVDFGNPTAEIATTVSVRTLTDVPDARLYVKIRPAGGPACAPSRSSDPGTAVPGGAFSGFGGGTSIGTIPSGQNTLSSVVTFTQPGEFQYCGWLYSDPGTFGTPVLLATASGAYRVATPFGAITSVEAPNPAPVGTSFLVRISGRTDVARRLYTAIRPASQPACATSPSLDVSDGDGTLTRRGDVLGSFAETFEVDLERAGTWRLCSWIASSSGDLTPLGVNDTLVTAGTPVPAVSNLAGAGRTLRLNVRLGQPGRLIVRLVRRGTSRQIHVTSMRITEPRSVTVNWRLPSRIRSGRYAVIVFFRPDQGTAREVLRAVTIR